MSGGYLCLCLLNFVEFPFVIFLWLILFLNSGAAVYALNFSCFYKHLLIDLFPLYFANPPDEINSLLSEFFISSQNYGLWPEIWASNKTWRSVGSM